MKSQTLESESPKTSKQKALLEMLITYKSSTMPFPSLQWNPWSDQLIETRQHCKLTKY